MHTRRLPIFLPAVALLAAAFGMLGPACGKSRPAETSPAPDDVTPLPPPPADAAPEPDATPQAPPEAAPDAVEATPQAPADSGPAPAEAVPLGPDEARVVAAAVNGLAGDLYPRLADGATNMAFSPAGIALALAMTSHGARGETAAQMNAVLHLGDDPDRARELLGREQRLLNAATSDEVRLAVANRLFGERSYTFAPEFLEWTAAQFAAPFEPVDFRGAPEPARARINAWVRERTFDRIPEILPAGSIRGDTRLVLANAVWFKGRWQVSFEERATRPRPFTRADGSKVDVPMMERTADYRFANRDGTKLLVLPYAGDELSMIVVLPPAGESPDPWLTPANLEGLDRLRSREVEVRLPRFKIDPPAPRRLNADLVALGMPRAFAREEAEFEGIAEPSNPDDRLYISHVFHRAFVEVNEEGTEAAAATAVVMAEVGGVSESYTGPPRFHADHPFLFLIRENRTGLLLFVGRVGDPSSGAAAER
ncbi:MAG: serpin family protein [Myxococcales bacterium]|nr:serpin family protein [Myxococcales bacterium]